MALNLERVGHAYPTYRYEVSREKIREYASALGESDPRYFSDGDDCVSPPTFVACYTIIKAGSAMLADDELGGHMVLVHGSQSFRYGERNVRPGDVIVCTPRIADISRRGRNELLTLEVDCRFEDTGELSVLSTGIIVFLGSAAEAAAA